MDAGLLAVITAVVGVATIAARVIEKLVDHIVEDRRTKKALQSPAGREFQILKGGYTTDLALQKASIQELREDVEKLQSVASQIDRGMDQLGSKQEQAHADIKELKTTLEKLRSALEGNTAATRALYDLLASQLKSGR